MKLAIPIWHARVSPVFDAAEHMLVVDYEDGVESSRHEEAILEVESVRRATQVVAAGVSVLICGAVSRPLEAMLASVGVHVISQVYGPTEVVLGAFLSGQLKGPAFLMPGCRGRQEQGRRERQTRQRNGRMA